jgi:hypothetical protein
VLVTFPVIGILPLNDLLYIKVDANGNLQVTPGLSVIGDVEKSVRQDSGYKISGV